MCRLKGMKIRFVASLFFPLLLSACLGHQPPAPYTHYGATGGADSAGIHTVSAADTVWNIAKRYRLSMQDIIYVNDLQPPYRLELGQRLKLPPPTTYKVRAGDSLYNISRTFNVSVTRLARQNNLQPPYILHEGDSLRMPSVAAQQARRQEMAGVAQPSSKPTPLHRASLAQKPSVRQAVTKDTPARAGGKFGWPVQGRVISSYGAKKGGLHNDGINIQAPKGTAVQAAENGVVVYAGSELEGYGNLVLVRHADRWMTAYAHMDRVLIKKGDVLKKGQSLGTVGSTGNVDSPQLHFEVRRGTKALDPKGYLGG